jgi:elongator complex protein 1
MDTTKLYSKLTAMVRSEPPMIEEALLEIANSDDPMDALKYFIVFVDIDHVFNMALGLYDLDLCVKVAECSNKDPREYLPFLNEFKRLEHFYSRFKIDDHLNRHAKALQNLSKCEFKFDECVDYINKHQLYKDALLIFKDHELKKVLDIYGDFLASNNDDEAVDAYIASGNHFSAIEACQKAGRWKELFIIVQNKEEVDVKNLAFNVCEVLKDKRLFLEAAHVMLEYGQNYEEAVNLCLQGCRKDSGEAWFKCHGRRNYSSKSSTSDGRLLRGLF